MYDDPECKLKLDHAVVVVGYGTTTDGIDYWLVKNSWGPNWGEGGYVRMIRNKNMCGIAEVAVYPNLNWWKIERKIQGSSKYDIPKHGH